MKRAPSAQSFRHGDATLTLRRKLFQVDPLVVHLPLWRRIFVLPRQQRIQAAPYASPPPLLAQWVLSLLMEDVPDGGLLLLLLHLIKRARSRAQCGTQRLCCGLWRVMMQRIQRALTLRYQITKKQLAIRKRSSYWRSKRISDRRHVA